MGTRVASAARARGAHLRLVGGEQVAVDEPGLDAPALTEAGRLAEREGRHAEARELYERALRALAGTDSPGRGAKAAALLRGIGRAHLAEGDASAALDCS